ncbi:MAG: hypothetical protein KAS64_05275 [Spirochaetes bacterium]|nr:hypothetical protein [Spirochaetota bacterium]
MGKVKVDHLIFNGIKKVLVDEAVFEKMKELLEDNQLAKYMEEVKGEESIPIAEAKKKFEKILNG